MLRRPLPLFQWAGVFIVVLAIIVIALSTMRGTHGKSNRFGSEPLLGSILVVVAQLFGALRGVVEERVMSQFNLPEIELAGREAAASATCCATAFALGWAVPELAIDDFRTFCLDVASSPTIILTTCILLIVQPLFQVTSLSVIKATSAVTKKVLSQLRTITVWVPSVLFLGGVVDALELVGFAVLCFGIAVYIGRVPMPSACYDAPNNTDDARHAKVDVAGKQPDSTPPDSLCPLHTGPPVSACYSDSTLE